MTRLLSRTFPSVKLRDFNPKAPDFKNLKNLQIEVPILSSSSLQSQENSKIPKSWSVYLILSTNEPIKTYVGITTDFARRFVYISSPFIFFDSKLVLGRLPFRFLLRKARAFDLEISRNLKSKCFFDYHLGFFIGIKESEKQMLFEYHLRFCFA